MLVDDRNTGPSAEERQRRLLGFVSLTGPVYDELTLHALTFLAQKLDLLDTLYEFDLGMNVPLSTTLGGDLYALLQKGHVSDTGKPGTISLTGLGTKHAGSNSYEGDRAEAARIMRTLAALEPGVILGTARELRYAHVSREGY